MSSATFPDMGLFKRNREPIPTTGQLMAHIAGRGNVAKPRRWYHFLYVADAARAAAEQIRGAGCWVVQRIEPDETGESWVVIAEQDGVVTSPVAVVEARRFFEGGGRGVPRRRVRRLGASLSTFTR